MQKGNVSHPPGCFYYSYNTQQTKLHSTGSGQRCWPILQNGTLAVEPNFAQNGIVMFHPRNSTRSLSRLRGDCQRIKRKIGMTESPLPGMLVRIIGVWLTLCLNWITPSSAQFSEDFGSASPSWEQREGDCIVLDANWRQRRTTDEETNNRHERIEFEAGPGSKLLVSHNLPPSFVISELTPAVRVKATRPGVKLMVRVVFPETPSPTGSGPLTTLLSGPVYQAVGQWQTLSFATQKENLQTKLRDEVWLLRRQHGSHINANNAYVDKVVLNLYCGEGRSVVQIDDLSLTGIVDAGKIANRVETLWTAYHDSQVERVGSIETVQDGVPQDPKQPSLVIRDGTVLLVGGRPFLPKIIQHRGESFEFLKALGFNVIELSATANTEQLQNARHLDLWLVCPPPTSTGLAPIGFQFDRVLAWSLGEELGGRNLENAQQRVREIRESDQREGRPIVAHALSHWTRYIQFTDILSVGLEPLGTSMPASRYSDWIRQRSQAIEHNNPVWADIQTDFPPLLVSQVRSIANVVPPTPIEPQQLRFLVYEAISGGARGLRFKSRSRLDASDPTSRLRALTIEWCNSEISRLEPWIAGGALREPIGTGDPDLEVNVISTNRSRLLLIQRLTHHEQNLAGDVPLQMVRFSDADTTFSDQARLLTEIGLQPLPILRNLGGNEIQIENCPYLSAVVLAQDPTIISRLNQSYQRIGQASTFQLHMDLTRQWLAIMQLIDQQMTNQGRNVVAASAAVAQANTAFQNFNRMIDANSPTSALPYLLETEERLALARRELVREPLGMFQSRSSSPLLSHVSLVPLHWELANRLNGSQWNPNSLPAGDFENLEHLTRAGWENRRLDDERVATKVELSDGVRADGNYSLRMEATPKTNSMLIDATPLWISSPKIPVRVGQLVRVHGWINIPEPIRGNLDGLMIIDSLGGDALAERIPITSGWQEFTLYRCVPFETDFGITLALTGYGVAYLDEITIRTVDLPSIRQANRNQ
jgi:hypothetical protein